MVGKEDVEISPSTQVVILVGVDVPQQGKSAEVCRVGHHTHLYAAIAGSGTAFQSLEAEHQLTGIVARQVKQRGGGKTVVGRSGIEIEAACARSVLRGIDVGIE